MKVIDKLSCPANYDCRNCINSREHNVGYHCSIHAVVTSTQNANNENRIMKFATMWEEIPICEDYNPK